MAQKNKYCIHLGTFNRSFSAFFLFKWWHFLKVNKGRTFCRWSGNSTWNNWTFLYFNLQHECVHSFYCVFCPEACCRKAWKRSIEKKKKNLFNRKTRFHHENCLTTRICTVDWWRRCVLTIKVLHQVQWRDLFLLPAVNQHVLGEKSLLNV